MGHIWGGMMWMDHFIQKSLDRSASSVALAYFRNLICRSPFSFYLLFFLTVMKFKG